MIKYSKFQPTQFDQKGLGLDDQQDWLVCPCSTNRDADLLTRANWESQIEVLRKFDSDDWEIHRFGHWGPGWFEIVIVKPDTDAAKEMQNIENGLADYPLIDDCKYSELEYEERCEVWSNASSQERKKWLRDSGLDPRKSRNKNLPRGVEINIY